MIIRKLKQGVRLKGLSTEMLFADSVVERAYEESGATELVITSGVDGTHSANSLHYKGCAIDYRRWSLREYDSDGELLYDNAPEVSAKIKSRLRGQFDVVLEKTHLHVEFDPKEA
jgi:hypothetical protein